jgi:hypothetical protein
MTEVSTTIMVLDDRGREDAFGGCAGLRIYRAGEELVVRGAFVASGGSDPDNGALRISADDAIALRDWLDEEFGEEPEPVVDRALWGGGFGFPLEGCACPQCERARGR